MRVSQTLSTCRASSIFVAHLLLLEVKPPRRLGIVWRVHVLVVSHEKVCDYPINLVKTPYLKSSFSRLENEVGLK
jgi:hypothetical protein